MDIQVFNTQTGTQTGTKAHTEKHTHYEPISPPFLRLGVLI